MLKSNRQVIETTDGSKTIFLPDMDETYHSHHGAMKESIHIFIEAGLKSIDKSCISIFEVGFGTGLNAINTLASLAEVKTIEYDSIELYPVDEQLIEEVGYKEMIDSKLHAAYKKMHTCNWEETVEITNNFHLRKIEADFTRYTYDKKYDLIYFDAFAPNKQEEMWTVELLQALYDACNDGAILVTYCVRGTVKRALKEVGFTIKKLPGPEGGKREMLRAIK